MSICECIPLAPALLTEGMLKMIQQDQRPMIAVARLIVSLGQQAISALQSREMRLLDANTGGAACQLQAIALYDLLHSKPLEQESIDFLKELEKVQEAIKKRSLTTDHLLSLKVSDEMLYLIRARMLTATKVYSHTDENGVIVTKTDPMRLSKLAKNFQQVFTGTYISTFVATNAKLLCLQSIARIQKIAAQLRTEDPLTVEMLSKDHIVDYKPEKSVISKPFSCLVFQMKALLQHLKEQQIPIVIKTIEKKYIHLNATTFDPEMPLIVFEGVAPDLDALQKCIDTIGFDELVLICAAQEAPYDPRSTLEEVKHEEGRKVIEALANKANEVGLHKAKQPVFLLDHVFCNAVKYEAL